MLALPVLVLVGVLILRPDHHGPNATARGLFPAEINATADAASRRLIGSWAAVSPCQDFDFRPQAVKGDAEYIVRCAPGSKITLDRGGATAGLACDGKVRGLLGGGDLARARWVHAHVDHDQAGRWGVALYTLDH